MRRGGVGAALLAAIAVGAATLETEWRQKGSLVAPREELRPLYDELYEQFRGLTHATVPQAHALAAWQRDHHEPPDWSDSHPARARDTIGGTRGPTFNG